MPPTAASRPSSAIAPGRAGSVVRHWVPSWMQPFLVLSGNQNTSWDGGGGGGDQKIYGSCQTFKKFIQQQVEWIQRVECRNEFFIYSLGRELF